MSTNFTLRKQNKSKVYAQFIYNVPIDNDQSHLHFTDQQEYEQKNILEKKNIDKIMQGTIKQRLFSKFTAKNSYMDNIQLFKLNQICRDKFSTIDIPKSNKKFYKTINTFRSNNSRKASLKNQMNSTFHCAPSTSTGFRQSKTLNLIHKNQLSFLPTVDTTILMKPYRQQKTERLNKIQKYLPFDRSQTLKSNKVKSNIMFPSKKLQINIKVFAETFKKWSPTKQTIVNDIKLNRDIIISKFKHLIDPKILQRFFYFFNFPQSFGLRQYVVYLQNAANANLRFIYFWIFITLDEVSNGVLNYQDLFQFLQKFPQTNPYIEEQIYELAKQIKKLENNENKNIEQIQMPPEQMLTVNRNLRIQQLQDLLKQTTKDRIQVNCVKTTYYHQTILSLAHNTLERLKMKQIEDNKLATQSLKNQMLQTKVKMDNIQGIRLRHLSIIFNGRRPKILCYVLHLLSGVRPQDYQ